MCGYLVKMIIKRCFVLCNLADGKVRIILIYNGIC